MKLILILILLIPCSLIFGSTDTTSSVVKNRNINGIELLNEINWDRIIPLCALVISIVSIIFTIIQVQLQRIHNKKTVKPIGRIRIGDYQDHIFIKIENNGLGPLIIKQILTKNKFKNTTESFIDILPQELTIRIPWTNFTGAYEGRTIIPGQSLELIVWRINGSYDGKAQEVIDKDRSDLRKALQDISISVTYTDVYEVEEFKHELTNEKFNYWYGRHEKQ